MRKLFGTDGIRGKANQYPMTAEMALGLGRAVATLFKNKNSESKIVIGRDTRISGDMLEHALVAGICSMGADALLAGVLPTPGVAYLTASIPEAAAGIVISASHNPFYDNGLKVFNSDGYKLSDEKEAEIEQVILNNERLVSACESVQETGNAVYLDDAAERYRMFAAQTLASNNPFKGIKVVLDCSNGATYEVAPQLFSDLGAETQSIGIQPNGTNINAGCGSQHTEPLIQKVLETGADAGLAFDGDGDRLIAVDEKGQIISGDRILAICAKFMHANNSLNNATVVSTVMSNIGLTMALKEMGIQHLKADVGDRYVLEKMISSGAVIGGEDSGHMIFLDHHTTGDGILTALRLLEVMQSESKSLSELSRIVTVYPQVLLNVEVKTKPPIESIPEIMTAIQEVEESLGESGRVLVRYSGTQPICRVMAEGPDEAATHQYCRQIADVIEKKIGS